MNKLNTGWYNSYHIDSGICGNMICDKCKKKIGEDTYYLFKHRYNINHRGNETDEAYIYHRKCSSNNREWKKHDKKEKDFKKQSLIKAKAIREIWGIIEKHNLDKCDIFEE